jgi:hypothetical protein
MTQVAQRITHYAGDSLTLGVTTKTPSGEVVDLTNSDIAWVLAESVSASPAVSKDTAGGGIVVTDALNGEFEIKIDPSDTESLSGTYYHEAELTDSAGNESTILVGDFVIKESAL